MSIISALKEKKSKQSGMLVALSGERLTGKSTLAGTLPGKTLLIQPAGIEAGNQSPVELAKSLGNHLDMIEISEYEQMDEILNDEGIQVYDNIYMDGISAYTEMVYTSPKFKKVSVKNKWDGFDLIKDMSTQLITRLKEFAAESDKNVFVTYALAPKYDANGNIATVEMVAKGNATKALVEGKCPNVVAVVSKTDDKGVLQRRIITSNTGPYVARLGNILDQDNPRVVAPDLTELLKVLGRV